MLALVWIVSFLVWLRLIVWLAATLPGIERIESPLPELRLRYVPLASAGTFALTWAGAAILLRDEWLIVGAGVAGAISLLIGVVLFVWRQFESQEKWDV